MSRLRRPLAFVLDRSLLLVGGAVAALVWANSWPNAYAAFERAAQFPINDLGMVFFFAQAAKEIVEATRPGGALADRRQAAVPLLHEHARRNDHKHETTPAQGVGRNLAVNPACRALHLRARVGRGDGQSRATGGTDDG